MDIYCYICDNKYELCDMLDIHYDEDEHLICDVCSQRLEEEEYDTRSIKEEDAITGSKR